MTLQCQTLDNIEGMVTLLVHQLTIQTLTIKVVVAQQLVEAEAEVVETLALVEEEGEHLQRQAETTQPMIMAMSTMVMT